MKSLFVVIAVLFLFGLVISEVSADTCTCICCIGTNCNAVVAGNTDVSLCSSCDATLCRSSFAMCPQAGMSGQVMSSCAANGGDSSSTKIALSVYGDNQCKNLLQESNLVNPLYSVVGKCNVLFGGMGSLKIDSCIKGGQALGTFYSSSSSCSGSSGTVVQSQDNQYISLANYPVKIQCDASSAFSAAMTKTSFMGISVIAFIAILMAFTF